MPRDRAGPDRFELGQPGLQFRGVCKAAGIGEHWTPRELRHSFVSLMSSSGVPVEEIARIAGHSSSWTTEVVYRRELRPILTTGAKAMDRLQPSRVLISAQFPAVPSQGPIASLARPGNFGPGLGAAATAAGRLATCAHPTYVLRAPYLRIKRWSGQA